MVTVKIITAAEYKTMVASKRKVETQEKQAFRHIMRCHDGVVEEFKFAPGRRFRADYAIPEHKLLIEYEGVFSAKSRHTTPVGYTRDCEKYNLAATLGYRVLRYTALNYLHVWADIASITKKTPPNPLGRGKK
jgi:very-short-patch-repair endonuclease